MPQNELYTRADTSFVLNQDNNITNYKSLISSSQRLPLKRTAKYWQS